MPAIKLSEKYKTEREEICKKIIDIIGTDFFLCDLEDSVEKQQAILALKDDIQKYFAASAISPFKPYLDGTVKRDYLIIIKYILKQLGYTIQSNSYLRSESSGLFRRTTRYKIVKDELLVHI
jgi:hypothetical protein